MLGLAIALPIIGAYIMTSVVLLNFPLLLHKKKQVKFRCRHISHRGGKCTFQDRPSCVAFSPLILSLFVKDRELETS